MCEILKQIDVSIIRKYVFDFSFQGKCIDTNGNATDVDRYDCERYRVYMSQDSKICGKYDNQDFKSKEMCCVCGGGRFGNLRNHFANAISLKL